MHDKNTQFEDYDFLDKVTTQSMSKISAFCKSKIFTVFENHRKSLIRLRAKRATFTFWMDNSSRQNSQTVLYDRSILFGKILVENVQIHKFKCDILDDFQTMWSFFIKKLQSISP